MTDLYFIAAFGLLITTVALLIMVLRRVSRAGGEVVASCLNGLEAIQERIDRTARDEGAKTRDEMNKAAREQRLELAEIVRNFGDSVAKRMVEVASLQKNQLEIFSDNSTPSRNRVLSAWTLFGANRLAPPSSSEKRW